MSQRPTGTRSPRRDRRTSRWVWWGEQMSRIGITAGGVGTIGALALVFLFLLYVVVPLFQSGHVLDEAHVGAAWPKGAPIQMGVDEDQLMSWALFADGRLQVFNLKSGELLEERGLFDEERLTAWSFAPGTGDAVFGFADGSVRLGSIGFASRFVEPAELPAELRDLDENTPTRLKTGIIVRISDGRLRVTELSLDIKDPAKGPTNSSVVKLDRTKTTTGVVMAVLTADGVLRLNTIREQKNLLTDEIIYKLSGVELPYREPSGKRQPSHLMLSAVGDQVYLFWKDGHMQRFDARDRENAVLAEEQNVLGDQATHITDVRALIGKGTFLVGDSSGRVRAWFFAHSPEAQTSDGGKMVCAHEFPGSGAAVSAIAVANRSRIATVAFADGKVRMLQITSEKRIVELIMPSGAHTSALAMAPKDNGVVAAGMPGLSHWKIDAKHPEITWASLFLPVWYEGYERPMHIWQSSGGTDAFEPKYGLTPLVFGTLKATFYSLLFGVPLALLAAIYTSEFMHPRTKALIKPTIELMASLPSVVLGFLAGLVFAQFVEGVLSAVLACLFTVPLTLLTGAYFWQMLPDKVSLPLAPWRFVFIVLTLPVGLAAAVWVGPMLESTFFEGSLRAWLDTGAGDAVGGWVFLLLPVSAIACMIILTRFINPWIRSKTKTWSKRSSARLDAAKFVLGVLLTLVIAYLAARAFSACEWDSRGYFVGSFSQRNALVVGFVMGFAIIPIVYTLAEDALSSVPEHLRAGSLAAGATRWQTATRIVIPTAMSGLFSAIMIGMGRAIGETMIVLMATGNTPNMDVNPFNGFRTLSANIAVELTESVVGGTHYRTLFLAALVLFAMTFVLNTVAETVRLRFRRRAYQL